MSGRDYPGPSAKDIGDMLRAHAERLAFQVFPNARKIGRYVCVDSLKGEKGDNLKITLTGIGAGTWVNYGTSKGDPRGKGDMLKLLQLTVGDGDIKKAIAEAKAFLRLDSMDPGALDKMRDRAAKAQARAEREKADDDERKRRNAEGMWQAASPLTPSSPAFLYLAGRGIDFQLLGKLPGAIRFHSKVWHEEKRCKLPAMVTKATALEGYHAATHVTYLEYRAGAGWAKLPDMTIEGKATKVAKKIFGPMHQRGAHISLWKGGQRGPLKAIRPGTAVEVSEGIEDGLSYAMANPLARVLAAGTLGIIGELRMPVQAGDFILLGQNDTKPQPLASREDAIKAQQAQARAQGSDRQVRLKLPPQGVKDWNDWLRSEVG